MAPKLQNTRTLDQRPPNDGRTPPTRWPKWLSSLVAAAGAIALWFGLRLAGCDSNDRWRQVELSSQRAEVVVTTSGHRGRQNRVADREVLSQNKQLVISYSNPQGAHQSLTVLAWDGRRLAWYSPTQRGEPPMKVNHTEAAWGALELPLKHHSPGHLAVVAAFDADPEAVASALMAGASVEGATALMLEVSP